MALLGRRPDRAALLRLRARRAAPSAGVFVRAGREAVYLRAVRGGAS